MDESTMNGRAGLAKLIKNPVVIDVCGQELILKTFEALKFGHCEGLPGWPNIIKEWTKFSDQNGSIQDKVRSKVSKAVVEYALGLIEGKTGNVAGGYIDSANDYISNCFGQKFGYIDPYAADLVAEIKRFANSMIELVSSPAGKWLEKKIGTVVELVDRLGQTGEVNTAISILSEFSGDHAIPTFLDSKEDSAGFHQVSSQLSSLVVNHLAKSGFTIISPLPYVEKVDGALHRVEGERPEGSNFVVARVIRLGLIQNGRVVDKAVVEACVPIASGPTSSPSIRTEVKETGAGGESIGISRLDSATGS